MKQLSQRIYEGYNETKYPLFFDQGYATRDEIEDYIEKYLINNPKLAMVNFVDHNKDQMLLYGKNVSRDGHGSGLREVKKFIVFPSFRFLCKHFLCNSDFFHIFCGCLQLKKNKKNI